MKFIKKHKKIIILIMVLLSIVLIYKTNNKNNVNYTAIGDNLALGKDSFGRIDYGYSDYIKDYLQSTEKLNQYIKSFSTENLSIPLLYENILTNKKIYLNKKEFNIKKTLRETTILTLSIGLNDLIYNLNTIENKTEYNLDKIIKDINTSFKELIKEIKKYYPNTIYVIGYYESSYYDDIVNKGIKKLNEVFSNNKDIVYIETNSIFKSNNFLTSNPNTYYPNRLGYKKISERIINKISKKLEK